MKAQHTERGPRGRYARLICHGCRSRKIKCVLPDPDGLGPLGAPQEPDKACKRCRAFDLECILDNTILGRPAAKRKRYGEPLTDVQSSAKISQRSLEAETSASTSLPNFKGYIISETAGGLSIFNGHESPSQNVPTQEDVFRSMIDPASFLASALGRDDAFASQVSHRASTWDASLLDYVDHDLAASLDTGLVWHRFFLPQLPPLTSIRARLLSDTSAAENSATSLLFSLLCVMAVETSNMHSRRQRSKLLQNIQLAISHHGQEFALAPPSHRDTVLVCLVLVEFRPTALSTSQSISRKVLKSSLYIDIACRVAERLGHLCPNKLSSLHQVEQGTYSDIKEPLLGSLQAMQLHCYDAQLGGFITKSLPDMQKKLHSIKPHVETYQRLLQRKQPMSPWMIYQLQYFVGIYMLLKGMVKIKQNWEDLSSLIKIIEDTGSECKNQTRITEDLLTERHDAGEQEEALAARCLMELHFQKVHVFTCGFGILYAAALKTRSERQAPVQSLDLDCHEATQFGNQVISSLKNEKSHSIKAFFLRIGTPYPDQQQEIVEKYVWHADNLKLKGVSFHPPLRGIVMDVLWHCKSMVENNVIQLKTYGHPHQNFERQKDLLGECAMRIEGVTTPKWRSVDDAFLGGCVYAAAGKLVRGFQDLMKNLPNTVLEAREVQDHDLDADLPVPPPLNELGRLECHSDGLDCEAHIGQISYLDLLPDQFDWSPLPSLFPEFGHETLNFE